ncbi:hypothetical protein Pan258_29620 [Symmachiella dynata]|uniref:hypothetical protein n=1 Tax=Symmachiella dynata TaxID=2527995 RepID=UPI0011878D9C|nr:hypothetical protein [Symmachiella dynata]QDT48915.1 hypothetical protein Pan258_29620 [Symmachiella dynata]
MTAPDSIDPNELSPGPIHHGSLPPELLQQVQVVYKYVGPYLGTTLEQFEIDLIRDLHPENEVAIWRSITATWIVYHKKHLANKLLPDEYEKKLLGALLAISTGVKDVEALGVPVDIGQKLLACYDALSEV